MRAVDRALDLVSPFAGPIGQRPFALAVGALYVAALAAQMLTIPWMVVRIGVWPFAIAQLVLLWMWFTLHAKRLRDAGHSVAPALGLTLIGALAVVLLLIAVAFYFDAASNLAAGEGAVPTTSVLALYVIAYLADAVAGLSSAGVLGVLLLLLVLAACAPLPIAVGFSFWAGTRASAATAASG